MSSTRDRPFPCAGIADAKGALNSQTLYTLRASSSLAFDILRCVAFEAFRSIRHFGLTIARSILSMGITALDLSTDALAVLLSVL